MPYTAKHRYAPISARKARLVVDMIRGLPVQRALDVLEFQPQRAAHLTRLVVRSALSNADEQEADVDELVVAEARVDEGPTAKRVWARGRGRADVLRHRTCHIIVTLDAAGTR
ncbi:MAG: 50S ribosomal protein L22 [Planctomycetes bacterium]|nr:50S ribosomal protein L22 [Planctomycetota bacterium]